MEPTVFDSILNDDVSKLYKKEQTTVTSVMSFLIGADEKYLSYYYSDSTEKINQMQTHSNAIIIRALCSIRTNLILHFTETEHNLVYDLKNLDRQPLYVNDVKALQKQDVQIIKVNYKVNKYLFDINQLIAQKIEGVKELFPEWVNWDYIKQLFIMPKHTGKKPDEWIKEESYKFINSKSLYPFTLYINWQPVDAGNILFNDSKFLSVLYKQHNETFTDFSKVKDASDVVKTNIYDFIENSESVVIVVDCENADAFKFAAVLTQLNENELQKISKIMLYDDSHTTKAWSFIDKITKIPVEHMLVERIKEEKSLVDIKMCVGISASFFKDNVSSFILCSSDSDFWGIISSLPDAEFLVMIENSKCGPDIKNALINNGTYYCTMDDFCTGNIKEFKSRMLRAELEDNIKDCVNIDTHKLLEDLYTNLRLDASTAEKNNFYNKYIKQMTLQINSDGIMTIKIPN